MPFVGLGSTVWHSTRKPRLERWDVQFHPLVRPNTKTQVTMEHKHYGGAVVLSCQHAETNTTEHLRKEIKKIINKVIRAKYLDENTIYNTKFGTGATLLWITGRLD